MGNKKNKEAKKEGRAMNAHINKFADVHDAVKKGSNLVTTARVNASKQAYDERKQMPIGQDGLNAKKVEIERLEKSFMKAGLSEKSAYAKAARLTMTNS